MKTIHFLNNSVPATLNASSLGGGETTRDPAVHISAENTLVTGQGVGG